MARLSGNSISSWGILVLRRPETDEQWAEWYDTRHDARSAVRKRYCQEHDECRATGEEVISMLGLTTDRWEVETRG